MKILVLYEELAWYFVNCLNVLAKNHHAHILIICKQPNANAPFQFEYIHPNIVIKDRQQLNETQLLQLSKKYSPDLIFTGGWMHPPYLKLLKQLQNKNSVIGFDNGWTGSFKQILGSVYFRLFFKSRFHFAFVPGENQSLFAEKIGFNKSKILQGAYSCDFNLFHSFYSKYKSVKKNKFPKRFLFVGRYETEKGIHQLWETFIELQNENPNEWELWCLGKGEIKPIEHKSIKHFGFVQANELEEIIKNTGVFVLPSLFEPWGVVVHEYVSAGFPLLCSDKVGSASTFLYDGENGLIYKAGDKAQLKNKLKIFMNMPQEKLNLMAEKSAQSASQITPEKWADTLMKAVTHDNK